MRAHNSTIKLKQKTCIRCGKPCYWFSKKRCKDCARIEDAQIEDDEEQEKDESLQNLVEDLDAVFSRFIRLKYSNDKGIVNCFTCHKPFAISNIQNGHYVHRVDMATRFLEGNCRPQCPSCNSRHNDDKSIFRAELENEKKGIADWLEEQAREVVKPTRDELKQLIISYRWKVKLLEKKIKK